MKWTNSYRSFGLKTKRSTGLKTIEHKQTGTVGDSRDNAMAESADGAYRTGLVWRRKPFHDPKDLGPATFRRVSWRNSKRLHRPLGYGTPEAVETEYYTNQASQAASL